MVDLRQRLYALIQSGSTEITADDLTANGEIAIDQEHKANSKQSGIGSFFRQMGDENILRRTGRVVKSKAPRRKGGMIQVWEVTDKGRREAGPRRRRIIRHGP